MSEEVERKLFGTDGVRGLANEEPMTSETALQLGRALAYIFKGGKKRHKIIIGKDTRLSCYMLEYALASGICSMGVDVLLVGPMPTPAIAFITANMRADAGAMISASHNLFQDNGIKFFDHRGYKLPDEQEARIEELIFSKRIDSLRPTAREVGKIYRIEDVRGRYIVFLKHSFPPDLTLAGLKIVVDCANGATYKVAPTVLYELGAEVIPLGVNPDGENINRDCGSLHPEHIAQKVKETGAHLGMALDGDGDRVIFCDENGAVIDGDAVMAILATEMSQQGTLSRDTLVITVMSNMGLEIAMRQKGISVVRTKVGDRYVVEEMLKNNYNLGGEQSGHVIFLDHNTTGDGIITALQLLAIIQRRQQPLSQLADIYRPLPQVLVNVKVAEKKEIGSLPELTAVVKAVEEKLGLSGRVLVRYSGTEPLARVMIEGEDQAQIKAYAEEIAGTIGRCLG